MTFPFLNLFSKCLYKCHGYGVILCDRMHAVSLLIILACQSVALLTIIIQEKNYKLCGLLGRSFIAIGHHNVTLCLTAI